MWWRRRTYKSRKRVDIERRKRTIIGASILLGIAVIIISSSYVSALDGVTINVVEVEGVEVIDEIEIQEAVEEVIKGRYLGLYARSNALIYPKKRVLHTLIEEFPRIKDISVELDSIDVLHITITERDPYALWCGDEHVPEKPPEDEECRFMDEEGVVYAEAPSFSGDVFLRLYGPREKDQFLGVSDYSRVANLIEYLREKDVEPIVFYIRSGKSAEIEVTDPNGSESILYVDIERDPKETVRNLLTLYSELTTGLNKSIPQLEYVDLRFGNRVFYKFRGESSFTAPHSSVQ